MYIVAIAWIYVVLLMSLTETSVVAGFATFICYGLAPLTVLTWLMGTPQRRRNRRRTQLQVDEVNVGGIRSDDRAQPDSALDGAFSARPEDTEAEASPAQSVQTRSFSQTTAAIRPQTPSRR